MAQTALAVQSADPTLAISPTFGAVDLANGNAFFNDGDTVVIVKNTDASAHNVTVTSAPDSAGRTGDVAISVPATTGLVVLGPFPRSLFNQTSGALIGDVLLAWASATGMTVAVVALPGNRASN